MFEKEAENYVMGTKAKEAIQKQIPYFEFAQMMYVTGAEFGYKKANEWHYVKDGDLPKKTDEYLVYRISGYGSKSIELVQYNSSRHFWCVDCQNEVIAWKEIVPPKESV